MAFDFRKLELVDDRTKLLGHGYMRELNNDDIATPKEIIFMCILQFYQFEQFGKHGECVTVSSNVETININNVATIKPNNEYTSWQSVYGEYEIDYNKQKNSIIEWTFDVKARQSSFGITNVTLLSGYVFGDYQIRSNQNARYYALADTGELECQDGDGAWNDHGDRYKGKRTYAECIEKGDTIKMILDLSQKSLTFIKNGIDFGIAYKDIDTSKIYKMAICMQFYEGDSVELKNFSVHYP